MISALDPVYDLPAIDRKPPYRALLVSPLLEDQLRMFSDI
jgi:hypothetical protein